MSLKQLPAKNSASPFASMKGHHVAVRVPDFAAAKRWYVEKLDFRVIHEWPYADQQLAYVAPATDDTFFVELLGDGDPHPIPKPVYDDLGDSLRLAGYHHFCLNVTSIDARSPNCAAAAHQPALHAARTSTIPSCRRGCGG